MLKLKPERRGFYLSLRGLADVSVSEYHVCSVLLHKVILSLENFGKTFRDIYTLS